MTPAAQVVTVASVGSIIAFLGSVILTVSACSTTNLEQLKAKQASAQAKVNIVCAGVTTAASGAADVTHRTARDLQYACDNAKATAAAITAAVKDAEAAASAP